MNAHGNESKQANEESKDQGRGGKPENEGKEAEGEIMRVSGMEKPKELGNEPENKKKLEKEAKGFLESSSIPKESQWESRRDSEDQKETIAFSPPDDENSSRGSSPIDPSSLADFSG